MAVRYKVCVDCADPHLLARFWAQALDYVVEDHSPLIESLLAEGAPIRDHLIEVDGRPAWRTAAGIRDPEHPVNEQTGVGQGGRILFQTVPEPKQGKNRLHLDLHVGADRVDAEAERLCGLGATRLGEGHEEGGSRWIVLADPEGNEFDVV